VAVRPSRRHGMQIGCVFRHVTRSATVRSATAAPPILRIVTGLVLT